MGGRTARRPSRSPSRSPLQSSPQPLLCHPPRWLPVCFGLAAGTDANGGAADATSCGRLWRRGSRCGPHWRQDGSRHASASGVPAQNKRGVAREADRRPAPNPNGSYSERTRPVSRPKLCTRWKGLFEVGAVKPGLPDYRHQRAGAQLPVVGHRDGGGSPVVHPLHYDVAAALSHLGEAAGFEDAADLAS